MTEDEQLDEGHEEEAQPASDSKPKPVLKEGVETSWKRLPDSFDLRELMPSSQTVLKLALPSAALAGAVASLELLRNWFQHSQMFFPTRYPTGIWDPSVFGLDYEDVWFESEDGVALHGWWIAHPKARATVVFCHGNTGSISDQVGVFLEMRRLKVNIFAFDYRGYGRSAGEPEEQGLFQDVRAACDLVHETKEIPFEQMVLFGHSMGGAVAVDGAYHRPVAALVVQSSFTQIKDMAKVLYPDIPLHLLSTNQFRSIEKVPELGMPKLFIHGTEDGTVPFSIGEALFAAAAEPKEWHPVPRAGHNDVARYGGFRYFLTLSRFLGRYVG